MGATRGWLGAVALTTFLAVGSPACVVQTPQGAGIECPATPLTATLDPTLQPDVDEAVEELSVRLGVPVETVAAVSAEHRFWPDSSLGCPAPGQAYLQVLTEGYRIELWAACTMYVYHGAQGRPAFLCPIPLTNSEPSPQN
jgi:hypothetical protein